ncbi:hypothetical protein BC834DRAFT_148713 [Gloeopeniophorella convolvens]|nr:hypothetical protein BC834DRAFT_148713 [Gloeopeniophorella convolvens]
MATIVAAILRDLSISVFLYFVHGASLVLSALGTRRHVLCTFLFAQSNLRCKCLVISRILWLFEARVTMRQVLY